MFCPIFGTSKGSKCFLLCAVGAVPSWLLAARSSCARIISVATDQMVSLHHQGSGSSGSLGGSRNGDKSTWRCWFFWKQRWDIFWDLTGGCKGLHTQIYIYIYIILIDWLVGWLVGWLIGWLIDWLIHSLCACVLVLDFMGVHGALWAYKFYCLNQTNILNIQWNSIDWFKGTSMGNNGTINPQRKGFPVKCSATQSENHVMLDVTSWPAIGVV